MIDNKSMDEYIIKDKALTMTKYQKIMFCLLESTDCNDLIKAVVREVEKDKPKFIISKPRGEKLLTKIYILIKTFIV